MPEHPAPSPAKLRKRWLPRLRFSLRTLVIGVLLIGSAGGLWWRWEPYVASSTPIENEENGSISCGGIAPNNRWIAVANRGVTRIFDAVSGKCVSKLIDWGNLVYDVQFSQDCELLATTGTSSIIQVWDWKHQVLLHRMVPRQTFAPATNTYSAVFSKDGNHILTADSWNVVEWDVKTAEVHRFIEQTDNSSDRKSAAYTPDETEVIIRDGKNCRIVNLETGKTKIGEYAESSKHSPTGRDSDLLAVSSDGTIVVTLKDYKTACVWSRRRPEYWWGVAWLPEFWLTVVFAGALGWSVWRDWKRLRGAADG